MDFFDCNCYFGLPSTAPASPATCATLDDLEAELDRAGIGRAIVWHYAQVDVSAQRGNAMLAEAIGSHDRLLGCWTLLPPQTGEMPVDPLLADMKAAGVVALRAFPVRHRWILNGLTLGPLLEEMVSRRIPLIYSMRLAAPAMDPYLLWQGLHQLMAEFPRLTLIVTDHGSWGCDRYFRPMLDAYERVYVDTSLFFLDGGIESLVERYPEAGGRLVFGSGLPERYPGGMMMYVRHAEIPDEAKALIAGGTLRRLIEEVRL